MATQIRLVLQQDVDNLGASGDLVRVRPGYARNFLIPRGLAVPATDANVARVEELKRQAIARAEKDLAAAQELAKKMESVSIKIERAVGEENKMYGSVTAKDIAEAFAARGVTLDRKKIALAEPIKHVGATEVPVKLHAKVTAKLKVEVVKASS
jgi:large subunit ribosomal protein L9